MKKRFLVGLVAGALTVAGAVPASAAVTYSTSSVVVPYLNGPVAVDASTNTLYATELKPDANDVGLWTPYLDTISTGTNSIMKSVRIGDETFEDELVNPDVRVFAKTHTVWVLLTGVSQGGPGGSSLVQYNAATGAVVRTVDLGTAGYSLALDGSGNAYVATGAEYDGNATATSPAHLVKETTAGVMTSVALPTLRAGSIPPETSGQFAQIAYDSANSKIYVTGPTNQIWSYTTGLVKSTTTTLGASTYPNGITVNGSTNTVFVTASDTRTGNASLLSIAGSTGKQTRSIVTSARGVPVIDPTINTVYVAGEAHSTTTLALTGTLPFDAVSVNGSTHAIFSGEFGQNGGAGQGNGVVHVIARQGK